MNQHFHRGPQGPATPAKPHQLSHRISGAPAGEKSVSESASVKSEPAASSPTVTGVGQPQTSPNGAGDPPSANGAYRGKPENGDEIRLALTYVRTVGAPAGERAKLTVTTSSGGRRRKIDEAVVAEQALHVLRQLMTDVSHDGDLDRIARRFLGEMPPE